MNNLKIIILLIFCIFLNFNIFSPTNTIHNKFFANVAKISKKIIFIFIITLIPLLTYANIVLAPLSSTKLTSTISENVLHNINGLNIIKLSQIKNFILSHPEFKDSYYSEMNPAYPQGCESFSYIVSEELEKEGIEHVIIQTDAHYYILLLVEFPNGIIKDVILDYTADQVIGEGISPVLETREILELLYPNMYKKYWKPVKTIARKDLKFDDSYLIFIEIWSLIHDAKEKFAISS